MPTHADRSSRLALPLAAAVLGAVAASPVRAAEDFPLLQRLEAASVVPGSNMGESVAVGAGLVVVGTPRFDGLAGADSGRAWVFDAVTGAELFELVPTDGAAGDEFGQAVAIAGTTVAVGASRHDLSALNEGAVYLFDATTGLQTAKLVAADGLGGDQFGISLALRGDRLLVGAPFRDTVGANAGGAYLFEVSTGTQLAVLAPADAAAGDRFGWSVDLTDELAVMGAPMADPLGDKSGKAYLFDATTHAELFTLVAPDGAEDDEFGIAVALGDRVAAVGAWQHDARGPDSGAAYLYDVATGAWRAKLEGTVPDGPDPSGVKFGAAVDAEGDVVLVGALSDNSFVEPGQPHLGGTGAAYAFDGPSARLLDKLVADDGVGGDSFGEAVALSDEHVVVGARYADAGAPGNDNHGAAYVFETTRVHWSDEGSALAGTGWAPHAVGLGELIDEAPFELLLVDALADETAVFFVGLTRIDAAFKGGVIVPAPDASAAFTTTSDATVLELVWPTGAGAGFELFFQFAITDAGAPVGVALSNAVRAVGG